MAQPDYEMTPSPHNQHGRRSRETDPEFFSREPVVYRGMNDIEDALDRGDLNYVNNWIKEQYQKTHNHE